MGKARQQAPGFTLIASLLLLLLLSGIAIGLLMMVNTEAKVGGADLQNNVAYHSAEGGIEKMASDLASTFQNAQSPTASQICDLSNQQPNLPGVIWKEYSVAPASGCSDPMTASFGQIKAGPNQGLYAQVIPITMLATAAEPGGQEVSMQRQAQVALIPVFQFGVFCEGDCSFFSGPNFDFAGRVHVNGDLYPEVGGGSTLTFHDKVTVWGNVVRAMLPNGHGTGTDYNGTVKVPTTSGGCDGSNPPLSTCRPLGLTEGSVTAAGGNPPQSSQNNNWPNISISAYNSEIVDGDYGLKTCGAGGASPCGTGAKKLSLPFVSGSTHPYEIIRRPPVGESPTSSVSQSREYNMAQIRVLLADDPAELPGGAGDAENIRLANLTNAQAATTGATASYGYGIPMPASSLPVGYAPPAGTTYNLYFAAASNAVPLPSSCGMTCTQPDWPFSPATPPAAVQTLVPTAATAPAGAPIAPTYLSNGTPTIGICPPANPVPAFVPAGCPATAVYPYYASPNVNGAAPSNAGNSTAWNLIDGYLRVEYRDAAGTWHPVTNEWLQLGFARGLTPPTAPGTNPVNPNAILLLQQPANRDGSGVLSSVAATAPTCTGTDSHGKCIAWAGVVPELVSDEGSGNQFYFGVTPAAPTTQSLTQYNWYPINFYDAREGEVRDTNTHDNSCTAHGVMNAVEIDVGNLKRWLAGQTGTSGLNVDFMAENGYVLYFSDRRGMLPNPNPPCNGVKCGDSALEDVINASSAAGTPDGVLESPAGQSPEDVNQNGRLDNFGAKNLGLGFYGTGGVATQNLNVRINNAAPINAYVRIDDCSNASSATPRKNWVSGARHVLRLVDGSLGNLPASPTNPPGGFTAASENPVYVVGDYNSNSTDTTWTANTDAAGHVPAAVIADTVTLLSNNWKDPNSFNGPTNLGSRPATNTWYRLAVAGGKNLNFPKPGWAGASKDLGTDGGTHNFLRYVENWGGQTLNYKGSLVSMYYSTYGTGIFKCCNVVYSPPTRNYSFDTDFTNPAGLPPGTPLFRDVDSLGYRQIFTARQN